jgi:hypothetical protein
MAVSSSSALRSTTHIRIPEDGSNLRKDCITRRKSENTRSRNRVSHILSVGNHHHLHHHLAQCWFNPRKHCSISRGNLSPVSSLSSRNLGFPGFELIMGHGEVNENSKLETSANHTARRPLNDVVCQAAPVSAPTAPLTKKV